MCCTPASRTYVTAEGVLQAEGSHAYHSMVCCDDSIGGKLLLPLLFVDVVFPEAHNRCTDQRDRSTRKYGETTGMNCNNTSASVFMFRRQLPIATRKLTAASVVSSTPANVR